MMKMLTLNTHSWLEERALEKLELLVETLIQKKYDIIALQEVNQSINALPLEKKSRFHQVDNQKTLRQDNFAAVLQEQLAKKGLQYDWTWVANHIGYDRFDEGVALLSLTPIEDTTSFTISNETDYTNYQTRKVIGIKTTLNNQTAWFYSVHFGWWNDNENPFKEQWATLLTAMPEPNTRTFLMGDFNSPATVKNEGYDLILRENWLDTFQQAKEKDSGITVPAAIDGWKSATDALRIDYIFTNQPLEISSSLVIFNGINQPVVSDHFGVEVQFNF
ncbi:endonuclease/exonuclease/phosphatase family protein [Carnobacterium divergens]|uniref:endonuclease/exonuclease/phosphatase family protein n=2 Tax=Carnobacterium TaxID=2747 RepID=UPI00288DB048|nr:endonuclease/exonuclease/phosphatase family protein [Carnobacterium divergens]MDT1940189.1 endonuclease/exonuclease/phosphatase family protein [Carnobacterium divergens]MDT1942627.1 endonuclease/exonuclease/phosphatase family protein [Carnobacterium divergens]MDT1948433.1 endonuclease/exonuclease/phosphatase family protein [Carnobacterium divergens]MDT1950914.1 endonuclease/exonuclease/phosphatase family protein [Carnobacterium divergens]MDT1955744.1 endonuclease/exonuclease/phosphatase fam